METTAFQLLLLSALCRAAGGVFGQHVYVSDRKTWQEARQHCRENYSDLPSVRNQEEAHALEEFVIGEGPPRDVGNRPRHAWIGLYRDAGDDATGWKWSDGRGGGDASFLSWAPGQPEVGRLCATQSRSGWRSENCGSERFSVCFEGNAVVAQNKTWVEALEYCREHHRDLASLLSDTALAQALQEGRREAQTRRLWTGLRYLAGQWLWVNGDPLEYEAWATQPEEVAWTLLDGRPGLWRAGTLQGDRPQCPVGDLHCGALSLEGKHWENWHCGDRLNFICSL